MRIVIILFAFYMIGCGKSKTDSIELITLPDRQRSIFEGLMSVTNNRIPQSVLNDSLAFLILPVQASCPACRKKTIDSIAQHARMLPDKHYVIIAASGGRKTIGSYFLEQQRELPDAPGKIFLDSLNLSLANDLYKDKPTMYYTYSGKAMKKVAAIPATVRDDLREFFSGHRAK